MELMDSVTRVCRSLPFSDRLVYETQLRRASLSVASGIAEGHERNHLGEYRQFVYIARGSLGEVDTGLLSIQRNCEVDEDLMKACFSQGFETRRMLSRLGITLKQKGRESRP